MEVQVFGRKKCPETRKALRFFAERRVKVHFADLDLRAASPGELRRFAQKFGVEALLDRDGKRFVERGLGAARYGEEAWLDRLAADPGLLRTPLVRWQARFTIGAAEAEWRSWTGR
jgi:arsenate reductase-like glutaredoxin family protein